jgi:hypothetical protein
MSRVGEPIRDGIGAAAFAKPNVPDPVGLGSAGIGA